MTPELTFTVPGEPQGWARPRFAGKRGFTAPKMALWIQTAGMLARGGWGSRAPLDEPCAVHVVAVMRRPKRLIPRRLGGGLSGPAEERMGGVSGRMHHVGKPDLDNVVKIVLDALVKAHVLVDDTRVCELRAWKVYEALDSRDVPCVEVTVGRMGG